MMDAPGLDEHRITELAKAIMIPIRANYHAGPISRDRVFEALNALAFATSVVLSGADASEAEEFFQKALRKNLTAEKEYRAKK